MAKHKTYKLKDYGEGWLGEEISADMNKIAREGFEIFSVIGLPSSSEVKRRPNELPGLNDGDSIDISSSIRVLYQK